jgi:uncharacterized protein YggE
MRVRAVLGIIVVLVLAAGCGSSAKKSAPAATSGLAALAVGGIGPTSPVGVVAVGSATQEVKADLAFVVVSTGNGIGGSLSTSPPISIGPNGQPIFSSPTTAAAADNHAAVRNALRPLGIASSAIQFAVSDPSGVLPDSGNGTVQVEVPVAKLPAIATSVVTALRQAGISGSAGLRFGVLDCTAAVTTARTKALIDAHTRALGLATAAGVTLGALNSVAESPTPSSPLAYLTNGGQASCGRSAFQNISGLATSYPNALAALTAKPQVELDESISAAYALATTATRSMASVGQGEASGPADAADIFVVQEQQSIVDPTAPSPTPTPTNVIDETKVLRALALLGVAKKDVEVENPTSVNAITSPSPSYVRVHVTMAQLKSIGTKIVATVQSVASASAASGVLFSASNCNAISARARAAAARGADQRLDKLAAAANVHLGGIVGVTETDASPYLPAVDPCKPDVSSATSSLLSGLLSGSISGSPSLSTLDATPVVTVQISLSISRAMTS